MKTLFPESDDDQFVVVTELAVATQVILTQVDEWIYFKKLGLEALAAAKAISLVSSCQSAVANCDQINTVIEAGGMIPGGFVHPFQN